MKTKTYHLIKGFDTHTHTKHTCAHTHKTQFGSSSKFPEIVGGQRQMEGLAMIS